MERNQAGRHLVGVVIVILGVITTLVALAYPSPPRSDAQSPPTGTPAPTPVARPTLTPIRQTPTPAPTLDPSDYDIINIALLGSDTRGGGSFRTDTIVIVSINRTEGTVSMLSIPRDLYVYIPGSGMQRINTAFYRGIEVDWPGGGPALFKDTVLYNLGIPLDYYALVDFDGFRQIIDTLGGVEVPVDCPLTDWRYMDGEWVSYFLPVGVHLMDGDTALWFARARTSSNDFHRNRRQQMLLRAIWRRALSLNILPQLPQLWSQITDVVETDIGLVQALELAPLAWELDTSRIESHFLGPNETDFAHSPGGASVLVPVWEPMSTVLEHFYTPPTQNRLAAERPTIEVLNGTPFERWDEVAADRLAWEGFSPTAAGPADSQDYQDTVLYDYTGRRKGSSLELLMAVLNVSEENVVIEPDPNREVDFRVVLGTSYNSCTPYLSRRDPE